jgi:trans-2,3-dihydro-3-hydroxyanthranilate isomerase
MAVLSYVVTDVFTDEAFGGNQLAVVFGGEGLSSDEMLSICRECASGGSGRVRAPYSCCSAAR